MDRGWAAGIYRTQPSQGSADHVDYGPAIQQREQTLDEARGDRTEAEAGTKPTEPAKQLCEQVVRKLREVLAGHNRLNRRFVNEPVQSDALKRVQSQSTSQLLAGNTSRYVLTACQPHVSALQQLSCLIEWSLRSHSQLAMLSFMIIILKVGHRSKYLILATETCHGSLDLQGVCIQSAQCNLDIDGCSDVIAVNSLRTDPRRYLSAFACEIFASTGRAFVRNALAYL